ncbi:MAG: hypothetical protein RL291_1066 [Pseudomonadota bacterium]|jgi:voltage-gated potassium channel
MAAKTLRARLRELYLGDSPEAHRFRYQLIALDAAMILFIIATSFMKRAPWISLLDVVFGLFVLADFAARIYMYRGSMRTFLHWSTLVDIAVIVSLFAPLGGESLGFLRILRTLRLLHTYQMISRLKQESAYFRRNEEVILAGTHLCVFIFIMTAIVYETQKGINEQIKHYADALYFTVTALTTTGFGDITLPGTTGRLLSVVIMLFGVTLFLRLAQVMFRPSKVRFQCPTCGLQRHDYDAVHCKACGTVLAIPDEGQN